MHEPHVIMYVSQISNYSCLCSTLENPPKRILFPGWYLGPKNPPMSPVACRRHGMVSSQFGRATLKLSQQSGTFGEGSLAQGDLDLRPENRIEAALGHGYLFFRLRWVYH